MLTNSHTLSWFAKSAPYELTTVFTSFGDKRSCFSFSMFINIISSPYNAFPSCFWYFCLNTYSCLNPFRHYIFFPIFNLLWIGKIVMPIMVSLTNYFKILKQVVKFISVNMVNYLKCFKFSTKMFFHDISMFIYIFSVSTKNSITMICDSHKTPFSLFYHIDEQKDVFIC